jgi:hypothetical protein
MGWGAGTGLIWLRTGAGDGLFWMQPRTSECHKMRRISWLAEDLLAVSRRILLHGVSFVCEPANALPKTSTRIYFSSESDIKEKSGVGNVEEQELTPHTLYYLKTSDLDINLIKLYIIKN